MEVAVLGHRGMLGSVVARYFTQKGATVWTTEMRYDGSDAVPEWAARFDLTVNCIRSNDWADLADLPQYLGLVCERVIQPSTDAINETSPYAEAKRAAEKANAIVIRAGIIDIENQPSEAYTNWLCNPLTPLEWARAAWRLREAKPGVYQLGREPHDRYEIARMVAEIWHRPPPKAVRGIPNDRVLTSRYDFPPLDVALAEYKAWLDRS